VRPHAIFPGDYDRLLTEHLVQGVDVWLNSPRRPWEACGTSGMKVLLNGGINLLELDGWWAQPTALPIAPVCRQSALQRTIPCDSYRTATAWRYLWKQLTYSGSVEVSFLLERMLSNGLVQDEWRRRNRIPAVADKSMCAAAKESGRNLLAGLDI
jgi:hypothetical protein